jgi:hypothetical protein
MRNNSSIWTLQVSKYLGVILRNGLGLIDYIRSYDEKRKFVSVKLSGIVERFVYEARAIEHPRCIIPQVYVG